MNRKAFKVDFKILSIYIFILTIIISGIMIANGVLQIKYYKDQVGTATIEEIDHEYYPMTNELREINKQLIDEYTENGDRTEKYQELSKKKIELEQKVKPLYQSKFMKQTGYHNPQNLQEYFATAPTLTIGIVVFAVGIIITYVLRRIGKERKKKERLAKK